MGQTSQLKNVFKETGQRGLAGQTVRKSPNKYNFRNGYKLNGPNKKLNQQGSGSNGYSMSNESKAT